MQLPFLFVLLSSLTAQAGYRVYVLKVYELDKAQRKVISSRNVASTLDPYQHDVYYKTTYPTRIKMADTWFCPGDTGNFRPVCEKPKVRERKPNSADKRVYLPYNRQPVIP